MTEHTPAIGIERSERFNGFAMRAESKFKIGQIWTDHRGRARQKIIAITPAPNVFIVTHEEDVDVWAYFSDGSFYGDDRKYDLVTLIQDVPAPTDMDGENDAEIEA